jgi:trk system potassium uptake protein TrkA
VKRFIIVGLGNFGATVAARLHTLGHDVIALDEKEDLVDSMGSRVARAMVADGTKRPVLEECGAREADAAIVSTGDSLAASVLALLALRDIGVKEIYVKVISDEHARVVNALGAEEAIFPERESANALASRLTAGALLRYVEIGPGLAIQEMAVPRVWYGRSLRELALPTRFRAQVVALHDILRDEMVAAPDPDRPLTDSDTLLVSGSPQVLEKLARYEGEDE